MKHTEANNVHEEQQRFEISSLIAASYVQGWLSHYAFTNRIAEATLTERVSSILSGQEVRSSQGDSVRVAALPSHTAKRTVRVQPMEMAVNARAHGTRKKAKMKLVAGKKHHHLSPKQRKEISRRMKQMWAIKRAA